MPFNRETPSSFVHSNVEVIGLFRAPTISSIDTDATMDDLPGAGRTVGRFFAWLGSKLEKRMNERAEQAGLGPKAIADEICRLAGHRQIWVTKDGVLGLRYYQCLPVAPGRKFNNSETKVLQKLCQKLIKHAKSHVKKNQLIALEEISNLAFNDPRIRAILANCDLDRLITHYDEPDLVTLTAKALGAVEFSHVHHVWAPVLSLCVTVLKENPGAHSLSENLSEDILETLRNPSTSFLSARYFQKASKEYNTLANHWQVYNILDKFSELYPRVAAQNLGGVEWSTFEACTSLGDNRSYCTVAIQDDQIIEMASILSPNYFLQHLMFSLVKSFSLSWSDKYSTYYLGNVKPRIYWYQTERIYKFVSGVTRSRDYQAHLSFIDHLSNKIRGHLKGTIFANKIIFTYYVLLSHTFLKHNASALRDMCTPLVSFMNSDCSKERSLATDLTEKFCTISRYCKLAALQAAQEISTKMYLSLQQTVASTPDKVREKSYAVCDMIPLRIQYRNACYIGEIRHPRTSKKRDLREYCALNQDIIRADVMQLEDFNCMDAMSFNDKVVTISVDGDLGPFSATGHHPIIAFFSDHQLSRPSYIARVRGFEWNREVIYFTHVEEGASFVTYQREWYDAETCQYYKTKEHRTSKFEVLALRYDPEDYRFERIKEGLSDPTGPLGWKNIYKPEPEVELADYLGWFP